MNTVIIGVRGLDEAFTDFRRAWETGKAEPAARVSFPSQARLWQVLAPKRWELLEAMTGHGEMTVREAAALVGRDVKSVHSDIQTLLEAGVLDRTEAGHVAFPYDEVRVELRLHKAA